MPTPIALCLEDLAPARRAPRYLSCVALRGNEPGLALDPAGAVAWRAVGPVGCELFVSLDEQLILLRPAGAPEVTVAREGRELAAPAGKPVVLLDGDRIALGARRLRVHVHGVAPAITAPAPVPMRARGRPRRAAAAALALGAALGCGKGIEVRDQPPAVMPHPPVPTDAGRPTSAPAPAAAAAPPPVQADPPKPDAGPPAAKPPTKKPPIEVRPHPPKMAPPKDWKGGGDL